MADADPRYAWRQELAATGAWVRRTPARRMVLPVVGSLVFVVFGVLLLVAGGTGGVVVGLLAILFFGVIGIPVFLWRARTGRPVLRLDPGGIQLDRVAVPWSEVDSVGLSTIATTSTVVVRLTPAGQARRRSQTGGLLRTLDGLNDRLTRGAAINIPNGYGLEAPLLASWIDEVRVGSSGGWASPSPGMRW